MPSYDSAPRKRRISPYALIAVITVLVLLIVYLMGRIGGGGAMSSATKLRCVVSQSVTPFADRILYYDDSTLFCLSTGGNELWHAPVGEGASFSAGERQVAVWSGHDLMIFDRNGHSSYSDHLDDPVQFARAGDKYVAIVTGDSVSPTLLVRGMDGAQVDSETTNYADLMILDCGFFGNGEYLWTTALDVYGSAPETTLHIYRVNQMNTGEVSLGEPITYAVVYSGGYLNVLNTRQLRLFDYRGVESAQDAVLVYGWQMIAATPTSSSPYLLFALMLQTDADGTFTELRLLHGSTDTRYSLPDACVGAVVRNRRVYAFSGDSLYRADINDQRFSALRLPVEGIVTDYLGMTSNGVALLVSGTDVWAFPLP